MIHELEKVICDCCNRVMALRMEVKPDIDKYWCPLCFEEAERIFPGEQFECYCMSVWCKRCEEELLFKPCEHHEFCNGCASKDGLQKPN